MNPKVRWSKDEQLEYWKQQYLQAKTNGDTRLMKIFADVILKLGGKVPKL